RPAAYPDLPGRPARGLPGSAAGEPHKAAPDFLCTASSGAFPRIRPDPSRRSVLSATPPHGRHLLCRTISNTCSPPPWGLLPGKLLRRYSLPSRTVFSAKNRSPQPARSPPVCSAPVHTYTLPSLIPPLFS